MSVIHSETDALLAPISPENPVGVNLEYEQIYDDIRYFQKSDPDYLPQDEWTPSQPRRADWQKVSQLCTQALTERSKDLQLSCWFVEALTHLQGVEGAEIGFLFLDGFIRRFWFECWPETGEEGAAFRYGKLMRLDRDVSQTLCIRPLLSTEESTLACWRRVQAFEHQIDCKPELRDELIAKEGDLTIASFEKRVISLCSADIGQRIIGIERLQKTLSSVESGYLALTQDNSQTLFAQTHLILNEMLIFLRRFSVKTLPTINEVDSLKPTVTQDNNSMKELTDIAAPSHPLSRELAISQMLEIANFFRRTEPLSPVPYLIERSVRWANMTLTEWLEEMMIDGDALRDINNVLKGR